MGTVTETDTDTEMDMDRDMKSKSTENLGASPFKKIYETVTLSATLFSLDCPFNSLCIC
jgi:hypothetical protein